MVDPRPEILSESQTSNQVDMEWAWPPIQAESNKVEFIKARLEGCDEIEAYERVLTKITQAYMTLLVDKEAQIVSERALTTLTSDCWSFQLMFNCPSKGYIIFRIEYDWQRTKLLSLLEPELRLKPFSNSRTQVQFKA